MLRTFPWKGLRLKTVVSLLSSQRPGIAASLYSPGGERLTFPGAGRVPRQAEKEQPLMGRKQEPRFSVHEHRAGRSRGSCSSPRRWDETSSREPRVAVAAGRRDANLPGLLQFILKSLAAAKRGGKRGLPTHLSKPKTMCVREGPNFFRHAGKRAIESIGLERANAAGTQA